MVIKKLLHLINLIRTWTLNIYKLINIIKDNENENLLFIIIEMVLLDYKGFNNSQKFIITVLYLVLARIIFFLKIKN